MAERSPAAFSPELRATSEPEVSAPFVIGIAGGTASGKTTVCRRITEQLGGQRVVLLSLDEFYRDLTEEEKLNIGGVNFDEPGAFDIPSLLRCLDELTSAGGTDVPVYDFVTSSRSTTKSRRVEAADVVILEGILVLHVEEIRERCNMKIFVDSDDDIRLARRIKRDIVERGRNIEGVIDQYTRFVKPSFEKYISPSKGQANIIIPWVHDNPVAVDLITQHVRMKLSQPGLTRAYRNFEVIPSTMQTRGMHTIIRDQSTTREDFVFHADRLCRLAIEHALAAMQFADKKVQTPTGGYYDGLSWTSKVCGVSIIRSGEAMETALRACCAGIPIGKLLVSSKHEVVYKKLPHDLGKRHIILMDPMMSSGRTATQAIEALLAEGADEGRIVLLTLIASPQSVRRVCGRYRRLRVITSEVDRCVDENSGLVFPGVGDFGDRYFGTTGMDAEGTSTYAFDVNGAPPAQVSNGVSHA